MNVRYYSLNYLYRIAVANLKVGGGGLSIDLIYEVRTSRFRFHARKRRLHVYLYAPPLPMRWEDRAGTKKLKRLLSLSPLIKI